MPFRRLSQAISSLFLAFPIAAIWLGEKLTLMAIAGGWLVLGSTLLITPWDRSRPA